LRAAMEDLQRTRMILRSQPTIRAPRNFTLSPQMVGISSEKQSSFQLFPVFRLTSVLATLLFVFVVLGDLLLGSSRSGAPATLGEVMEASAPQQLQAVTEAPGIVENDVIVESEMAEKSLDLTDVTPMEAPAFEMPSEGEALERGGEPLPLLSGTPGPPTTITPPTETPTLAPTATIEGDRRLGDEVSTSEEPSGIGGAFIRSGLVLRILEVFLALLGVITAALAFYLRPVRRS
jgi:hypothetical protein